MPATARLETENEAKSNLENDVVLTDTTITLKAGEGARYPSSGSFRVTLFGESELLDVFDPTINEIFEISSRSGDVLTINNDTITDATNAAPIVLTSNGAHELVTGDRAHVFGVGGNTAANGTRTITVLSPTTYSLNGSTGNGAYTSGGTWTQRAEESTVGAATWIAGDVIAVWLNWTKRLYDNLWDAINDIETGTTILDSVSTLGDITVGTDGSGDIIAGAGNTTIALFNTVATTVNAFGVATAINMNPDVDSVVLAVGRAKLGDVASFADFASFSHFDHDSITNFALGQLGTGQTFLNTASGTVLSLRVNNVDEVTIDVADVILPTNDFTLTVGDLTLTAGDILLDGLVRGESNAFRALDLTTGADVSLYSNGDLRFSIDTESLGTGFLFTWGHNNVGAAHTTLMTLNDTGTLAITVGDLTVAGDIILQGGDLDDDTNATVNVFATPTTVNFAATGSTVNIGASSSTTFIQNKLDINGGIFLPIRTVTTTATATSSDFTVLGDATSGAFTITLPALSGVLGLILQFNKIDVSGNAVTIDGDGSETINGSTTQILSTQFDQITVQAGASEWVIVL